MRQAGIIAAAGCTRSTTTSSAWPKTTPTREPRRRPAGQLGVASDPAASTPTSSCSSAVGRRAVRLARRTRGHVAPARAAAPCARSRTSTSTRRTPSSRLSSGVAAALARLDRAGSLGTRAREERDAAVDEPGCAVPGDGVRADLRPRRRAGAVRPVDGAGRRARPSTTSPRGRRAHRPAAAVPPAARRGAARPRPPVLDRGPELRPRLPHPRHRGAAARRRPPARRDRRAHLRPAAGPLAGRCGSST